MKFCILPFLNNPKDQDPSYKMDLDFGDCFGKEKTLSFNRRNTVVAIVQGNEMPSFKVNGYTSMFFSAIFSKRGNFWGLNIGITVRAAYIAENYIISE